MLPTREIEIAWYKQFPSPTTLCAIKFGGTSMTLWTVLGSLAATPQIFGRIYLDLIVDSICSLIWNINMGHQLCC